VSSSVRAPIRAAASAASVPAWPPPMTITSKLLENRMARSVRTEAVQGNHSDIDPFYA
jgi:hypothetical protein